MEKVKPLTLEDDLTILPCRTRSSLWDTIPVDILIDIFLRVPAKSICRFRSVSKFWASIAGRPDFTELFLTKSLTRPRLLFTVTLDAVDGKLFSFFTSPQHENSPSLVATPHCSYSPPNGWAEISPPVRGWVCIEVKSKRNMLFVIRSSVIGKSITLPKLTTKMFSSKSFFGYDPIDKQFKVLCTNWPLDSQDSVNTHAEHYVLTLGTEQMVWRLIDCCKPLLHPAMLCGGGICINGVLYYIAELSFHEDVMIACFDIRFEKFSFINRPKFLKRIGIESRLINHKGQLCIIQSSNNWRIDGYTTSFTLWVLNDTEKHVWTKIFYKLPLLWWDVVQKTELHIVGMSGTYEIVLAPPYLSGPFYLFYYNLEMNIVKKVKIQGFEAFEHSSLSIVDCFLDYVEDVKLI